MRTNVSARLAHNQPTVELKRHPVSGDRGSQIQESLVIACSPCLERLDAVPLAVMTCAVDNIGFGFCYASLKPVHRFENKLHIHNLHMTKTIARASNAVNTLVDVWYEIV
jgi:hypothetical protein